MNLTCAQRQLLTETIEPLLAYANLRLGTVSLEGLPDEDDRQSQAAIVARALWQHVDVIGDYVRENPDHLSGRHLSVASDLMGVLYDDYIFEGTRHGRAVFLHETGTYQAVGIDEASLGHLPNTPMLLRTALVPFQGLIVPLMPMVSIGVPSEEHRSFLRQKSADHGAGSPTADGDVLASRAKAFREVWRRRRESEVDAIGHAVKGPGAGYHAGALGGLAGDARKQAIRAHADLVLRTGDAFRALMEQRSVKARRFPLTLEEGLRLLDDDWLDSIAERLEGFEHGPDVPRERLVRQLAERLPHDQDLRDTALAWCQDAQFELVRTLLRTNPLSLVAISPSRAAELYPMVPYVFVLQEDDAFVAWMPPEIRTLIAEVDIDEVARMRAQLSQAARAADALASMCGIVEVSQAHRRYREVADDPLDLERFELVLEQLETCESRDSYALWEHDGTTYLISAELSDASALAHVVRDGYAERMHLGDEAAIGQDPMCYIALDDIDEEEFCRRLDERLEALERERVALLARLPRTDPHPLPPELLEGRITSHLLETEPLRRVRAYVDAHMPDDEDDYVFPETFARAVVISALFVHESYEDVLDLVRLFGMEGCEGKGFPHTLGRLLTNAFNALPRWELRGWSLEENTERITGRRRRYRADGTLIE